MKKPLSRRALLRGAGGAALALPFLEAMLPAGRAHADEPLAPKRIVFFMSFNGTVMSRWKCQPSPTDSSQFALSDVLAPLEPIRDRCLFLEGVPMASSHDPAQQAIGHQAGASSCLTGTWAGPGDMPLGDGNTAGYAISETIDHALAQELGSQTKFPAYYFGVMPIFTELITTIFYEGKDQPITPNSDPWAVHDQLFGDLDTDSVALDLELHQRERVLDAVIDDLRSLRCKLGGADRQRLDQHLTQVEEIESRLYLGPGTNPACEAPSIGAPYDFYNPANIPALGKLQMDQLAMALTCDLTRVAGLQWITPVNGIVYDWLGHDVQHHDLSHLLAPLDQPDEAWCKDRLVEINAWYAEQLVYLAQKLASVPEGDGTLLDNTLIVWGHECGDPWAHDTMDVPWVLCGNAGGYFDTGRYLKMGPGATHNRLLLNLFEAMGAPRATFGAATYCAGGPLPGLGG